MAPPRSTSFDDVRVPRAGPVMDSVDDELRDMVALMPGRNAGRMFSDAGAASAPSSLARGRAPAPDDPDSASYYYYYSSTGGNTTRANLDAPPVPPPPRAAVAAAPPQLEQEPPRTFASTVTLARDNVADALQAAAGRFVSDDLARIGEILSRRGRRLSPALRAALAHAAELLAGLAHLRRLLATAGGVVVGDTRVRDLARRTGWGAAATLRLALALAGALAGGARRVHEVLVGRVVPAARVAVPRGYAGVMIAAMRAARNSPWALVLGPASVTLALRASRIPDPLALHRRLGVGPTASVRGALEAGGMDVQDVEGVEDVYDPEAAVPEDDEDVRVVRGVGEEDNRSSLSYTYTYATGTTKADDRLDDVDEPRGGGSPSSEYYYTYGTGTTFAGADTTIAGSVGAPVPFGASNAGGRAGRGKRADDVGKENDRRRSIRSDFDEDDAPYDY